ncbi:MAG TPA: helicase C-terminal domain-containing protein [Tepidiformaceae bacterium]|nr:helicase C-terminal domain-containing protein [Tepidiformaceae bacterium]
MTPTYVALDIETTGLDPERDRITEIGAVRFRPDGTELETFETLVNPGREIPFFIEQLTGVTNEAVRGAKRVKDVMPELLRFVGNDPVVGQNINFDLSYLRREGAALGPRSIDTAELSRILMPARQPRNLVDLAATLGVEAPVHHRALPDARTAAAVFVALLHRLERLPTTARYQLARLVSLGDLPLAELIGGDEWSNTPLSERHLPTVRPGPEYPQLVRLDPRVPVQPEEVSRAFDAAINVVERFEERQEQRAMAEAVRRAMTDGGHWLIEAGTGVGKSLAYLLPAALHALRNGDRVVISTNTINLQEQLLSKDIPALRQILQAAGVIEDGSELRASVLKGRSNYLCLRRWIATYGSGLGDPDFAHLAAAMLLWLPETDTGDRSELNLDKSEWTTWQRFSAQDTDCLARQNSYVREGKCFLQRARKAAESAHLIIVNHALLLADVASGGSAIPAFDHLIIDEAHNLEDQATQQFGGSVSRRTLSDALDALHRPIAGREHREGGVAALLNAFPDPAVQDAGKALQAAVARAHLYLGPAFDALAAESPRPGEDDRLLVSRSVRTRPTWSDVEIAWAALDRSLRDVGQAAALAAKALTATKMVEEPDVLAGEVDTAARKLDESRAILQELMSTTDDATIVWIGRERDGGASLNAAPLDVGPRLWEELLSKRRTVVATSATLSAGGTAAGLTATAANGAARGAANGAMEYSARRLGFDSPEVLQLGSPFDYHRSTLLAAFTDIPEPNSAAYTPAVADAILQLVRASEGRALALFTSHAALRSVAAIVRPELERDGIVVLAQGIDGDPRRLTELLQASPRTLILGTSSFWEGVDVRGDALSMLIIAKLPFGVPSDPIYKARSEQYDSPFGQYALPGAILKFRQGFGRLIRDREDRGVVAVLDRRIWEKSYGAQFVSALPDCTRFRGDTLAVASRAREWLEQAATPALQVP